jgi:hypothetical protein
VESPKKELSIMFGETANKDQRIGGKRMGGDLFYQRGDYNEVKKNPQVWLLQSI